MGIITPYSFVCKAFNEICRFIQKRLTTKIISRVEPGKNDFSCEVNKQLFFFYLGFLSRTFTNHRTAGEGGGHFFNSSSQAVRHQPSDYCRELTSAYSQQPGSDREPLVPKRKLLTTKLCVHGRQNMFSSLDQYVNTY